MSFNWWDHTDKPKPEPTVRSQVEDEEGNLKVEEKPMISQFHGKVDGYFIYKHPIYGFSVCCPSPYRLIAHNLSNEDKAIGVIKTLPPVPTLRDQILHQPVIHSASPVVVEKKEEDPDEEFDIPEREDTHKNDKFYLPETKRDLFSESST